MDTGERLLQRKRMAIVYAFVLWAGLFFLLARWQMEMGRMEIGKFMSLTGLVVFLIGIALVFWESLKFTKKKTPRGDHYEQNWWIRRYEPNRYATMVRFRAFLTFLALAAVGYALALLLAPWRDLAWFLAIASVGFVFAGDIVLLVWLITLRNYKKYAPGGEM